MGASLISNDTLHSLNTNPSENKNISDSTEIKENLFGNPAPKQRNIPINKNI